jgi:hypothetical protein
MYFSSYKGLPRIWIPYITTQAVVILTFCQCNSTTRCTYNTCILSMEFAKVGCSPYVYTKGSYIWTDHTSLGPRSPTFAAITCGRLKILMRFHLTISNGIIPPTYALEISGDYFSGPHTLPARVSGCDYLNFLRTHLSGILEDVPFNMSSHVFSAQRCSTTL